MIYFDNASTSGYKPDLCKKKILEYLTDYPVTPSRSSHRLASLAQNMVISTKEKLKDTLGIQHQEIFFTNNATQSLNVVIRGLAENSQYKRISFCSNSHNSCIRATHLLHRQNKIERYHILELDQSGNCTNLEKLSSMDILILNHGSNVTGVIPNIPAIVDFCRKNKIISILDATQSAGVFHENYNDFDIVLGTGHKSLFGPTGVGFFTCSKELANKIDPLIVGGTGRNSFSFSHPKNLNQKFEAGTPNLTSIAGLNGSLSYLQNIGIKTIRDHTSFLRDYAIFELKNIPQIIVHDSELGKRLPVISFNISDAHPNEIFEKLDSIGIFTRAGLHCAPLVHQRLGNINGSLRISFSHLNEECEIAKFINEIRKLIQNRNYIKIYG